MFYLKKIVSYFLLPPGCFVVLLFLSGGWLLLKRRMKTGSACLALAVLMWVAAISPVADLFLQPLESGYAVSEQLRGDVIILLCGGASVHVPDLTGTGRPTGGTMARLVEAARLHRMLGVPIIVSGGSVFSRGKAESVIVRRFLTDIGVAPEMIVTEDRSRDTFGNARHSAAICRASGFRRPMLVTEAYHLPRSVWCFRKAGLDVVPVPVARRTFPGKRYHWTAFLPRGYGGLSAALHEHLGLIYYRMVY